MTNEELVRRYYGGDERALEELYRRNLGLIRRIARETAESSTVCIWTGKDRESCPAIRKRFWRIFAARVRWNF